MRFVFRFKALSPCGNGRVRRRVTPLTACLVAIMVFGLGGASIPAQSFPPVTPPVLPSSGFWTEVITVTPGWLVLQDSLGRQYPLAATAAGLYTIRALVGPGQIPPNSLAMVFGTELPNSMIGADHVDLLEGPLRLGARPGFERVLANGLSQEEFAILNASPLLRPLLAPSPILALAPPSFNFLVGPLVSAAPVQVASPGSNQIFTIVANNRPPRIFRVNRVAGDFKPIAVGDLVYVVPAPRQALSPRTLVPSEITVYKNLR